MNLGLRASAALATVVALVGCVASSSTTVPGGLGGTFGPGTVAAAIELLAEAGVPVRVRPSEAPMVTVSSPSRIALLRFQARNLALEANRSAGTAGADLDAYTGSAGGVPISHLIAGWARTADTAASRAAAPLLGDLAGTNPPDLRIPGLAVVMFLADLTGTAPQTGATAAAGLAPGPATAAEDVDFCGQVAAYLASVLEGVLDPGLTLEPDWLQRAIDLYAGSLVADPEQIRTAVGALALLAYATSISKPWIPFLAASPTDVHYLVGRREGDPFGGRPGDELSSGIKTFRVSIDAGEGSFAEETGECAELADASLAETELDGSTVGWVLPELLPHTSEVEGDLEIENGTAVLEYQTRDESDDTHQNGTIRTAFPRVFVVVKRQEIEELEGVVRRLLTGGDLGVTAPTVHATYTRLQPLLRELLYPRAMAAVQVTWHEDKDPTPTPRRTVPPGDGDARDLGGGTPHCGDGCAASNGDPHLVPVSGSDYDFQAAGEYVLLRSPDGAVEIHARQVPGQGSDSVSINAAIAARVAGRRVALYQHAYELEMRIDGETVTPSSAIDLGGGGRLEPRERGVELAFPDGTRLWAVPGGAVGIDLVVSPSETLREQGTGLLGPAADEGYGLPRMPDGSIVPAPRDDTEAFDLLYGAYEEAWRVTAASSLFDYGPGESPETFLLPDFPARPLTWEDLTPEQIAAGEAACAGIGIALLRRQCVFDVAATGDPTYAEAYEAADDMVERGSEGLGAPGPVRTVALPTPEPTPMPPAPAGVFEVVPELDGLRGSALGPDGTLYMSVDEPGEAAAVMAVDPATGEIRRRVETVDGGQVGFAAGSVWVADLLGVNAFPGLFSCSISRLDPESLEIQTTVQTECVFFHQFAATADAVWSPAGDEGGERSRLRRIDPSTNVLDEGVELPFNAGFLEASRTTVFYGDHEPGWYRLPPGGDAFQSLGVLQGRHFPAGEGLWVENEGGASFFTSEGVPAATLSFDGNLTAADEQAVYYESFDASDGSVQLVRQPLDGGPATTIASEVTLGTPSGDVRLGFNDNRPLFLGDDALVKLWLVPAGEQGFGRQALLVQRVELP